MKSAESRRYKRYHPAFDVEFLDLRHCPTGRFVRIVDMGGGGLGIETNLSLALNQEVGFQVRLSNSGILKSHARVRWQRADGLHYLYGLELEGLGAWDRGRLIAALNPRHFGLQEVLDCFLQASAFILALYVFGRWTSSGLYTLPAVFSPAPYGLALSSVALYAWLSFRQSSHH